MQGDRITANLPSRDFAATEAFYAALGFTQGFRDDGWMILTRGALEVEFFPAPDLDPWSSWHSACLRVGDLPALYTAFARAGLSANPRAIPRLTPPQPAMGPVPPMFALVDADGSLLRCLANGPH